jgi:hypothetical protein
MKEVCQMELSVQDLQKKLSDLKKGGLPDGMLFNQMVSGNAWQVILEYLGKMLASLELRFLQLQYASVTYTSIQSSLCGYQAARLCRGGFASIREE